MSFQFGPAYESFPNRPIDARVRDTTFPDATTKLDVVMRRYAFAEKMGLLEETRRILDELIEATTIDEKFYLGKLKQLGNDFFKRKSMDSITLAESLLAEKVGENADTIEMDNKYYGIKARNPFVGTKQDVTEAEILGYSHMFDAMSRRIFFTGKPVQDSIATLLSPSGPIVTILKECQIRLHVTQGGVGEEEEKRIERILGLLSAFETSLKLRNSQIASVGTSFHRNWRILEQQGDALLLLRDQRTA
jgi:hypothetical protein